MAASSSGIRLAPENRDLHGSEMYELLDRACARRVLIQVIIKGEDPPVVTRIATIFLNNQRKIDIYAFGVGEMDRRMEAGVDLDVSMMVDNLPYHFKSRCLGTGTGIRHHSIEIPAAITAIQRRAYFRVTPPSPKSLQVRIKYDGCEDFLEVEALDLSVGGMLFFDRTMVAAPDDNSKMAVLLKFDDGQKFAFPAFVRRAAIQAGREHGLALGVQFNRLPASEETALGNIIMRWQREIRRRIMEERAR